MTRDQQEDKVRWRVEEKKGNDGVEEESHWTSVTGTTCFWNCHWQSDHFKIDFLLGSRLPSTEEAIKNGYPSNIRNYLSSLFAVWRAALATFFCFDYNKQFGVLLGLQGHSPELWTIAERWGKQRDYKYQSFSLWLCGAAQLSKEKGSSLVRGDNPSNVEKPGACPGSLSPSMGRNREPGAKLLL